MSNPRFNKQTANSRVSEYREGWATGAPNVYEAANGDNDKNGMGAYNTKGASVPAGDAPMVKRMPSLGQRSLVGPKIEKLRAEGTPQKQAVAMALSMGRAGRLMPGGGYKRVKSGY